MNGYDFVINAIQFSNYEGLDYGCTYIVYIKYKYEWEDDYTLSYEVMSYDLEHVTWFNDWWEGQDNIIVVGIINIDDLSPTMMYLF